MASIRVYSLLVAVYEGGKIIAFRRPTSTNYCAGYTLTNGGAIPGSEAHELLGDAPANGVDGPSNMTHSYIEATVVGGDVGAGVVLPFDLSDPTGFTGPFTFKVWVVLAKTVAGTFPANVVVRLKRNSGSDVASFTIAQSTIVTNFPSGPGWYEVTLTANQVAAAMVDQDAHISVEISNGIPV